MEPVQITPKASSDIAKLAQGANRAEVALAALADSELTLNQVKQLEALLKKVSAPPSTPSPAVSEIKAVDGHQAVVGQITVNEQRLDTLLSEGSFNKSLAEQASYAERLGGYRVATREENRVYVGSLLAKEEYKSINAAEAESLQSYRERYVRDTQGGLDVAGRRVRDAFYCWHGHAHPNLGALFVRASAESK